MTMNTVTKQLPDPCDQLPVKLLITYYHYRSINNVSYVYKVPIPVLLDF